MYVMFRRCLLLAALLIGAATLQAQDPGADLAQRVNRLRASQGLPAMRLNNALGIAARSQARWMAETGLIRHTRPDGTDLRARTRNAGYPTTWVAEIIYMGASVQSAWNFWLGSKIHYDTLVGPYLQEMGIGYAGTGRGRTAFVIVFGNPGGAPVAPGRSAPAGPPSYVVGRDPRGFIMHRIQPEDTLGLIALIYGYSWDDLPYMRTINGMEENDNLLKPGEIFLVPPADGTYTPTPGTPVTTATPTMALTPSATATATRPAVATSESLPPDLVTAARPPPGRATFAPPASGQGSGNAPLWVILALGAQAALLGLAVIVFVLWRRR